MLIRAALFALALSACGSSHALDLACEQELGKATLSKLPKRDYARFVLSEALMCSWSEKKQQATRSLLFKAPVAKQPVEIEIGTWLTVKETTATHVALLNGNFEPIKWIPFNSFRERRGYLTARFFVNPDDSTEYVLIGGAPNAEDESLVRTYSPLSSTALRFAGLITAREVSTEFKLVPEGKVRVKIRWQRDKKVTVID